MPLTATLQSDWDNQLSSEHTALALTSTQFKFTIVEIDGGSTALTYDEGYDLNLRNLVGVTKIIGLIPLGGKVGAFMTYDNATDKVRVYDTTGTEVTTVIPNDDFESSVLVIGI